MLRGIFIYLSRANWARSLVTKWRFAWKAASRFVAGEKLDDAIQVVKVLNMKGINATLDHLGEHTSSPELASQATAEIIHIIDEINKHQIRANVSIKLTQIGLALDEDLCVKNLLKIIERANLYKVFIRIDMEDSAWTNVTLKIYQKLLMENMNNAGIVIQAYLYSSENDLRLLLSKGGKVRLCKGAYKESSLKAFPKKKDVDANFDILAKILIDAAIKNGSPVISEDGKTPPIVAIASHDPKRLEFAKRYSKEVELPAGAIEFQMLHGIRRDLQEKYMEAGFPVRVYIPFGEEWYPYFMRRLAERPANIWFFVTNLFKR